MTNTPPAAPAAPAAAANPPPDPAVPASETTDINSSEETPQKEEWELQRDAHKSSGDDAFRSRDYPGAIRHYSAALSVDPTNHILLSNRSASYLSNGEKSRALADARECVKAKPEFVKGHTRLAAAMVSLGRYSEARSVYSEVLKMDVGNVVAKKGVEDCRAREQEAQKREVERVQREMERAKKAKEEEEGKKKAEQEAAKKKDSEDKKGGGDEEDDLLGDFFSEVESVTAKKKDAKEDEKKDAAPADGDTGGTNQIQVQLTDLGGATEQINRLLMNNYEWKNLNPYYVLAVPHTASADMISRRYKALSLLVHPDKCPDPRAKDAFEEVRKAMNLLNDTDKARHAKALVERGLKQGRRDYESNSRQKGGLLNKSDADAELAKAQEVATMKIFAEVERSRRDVERRKRNQEKREREQEDEEVRKAKKERDFEKRWREGERVEKRIGNWRDFQKKGGDGGGESKKKSRWS